MNPTARTLRMLRDEGWLCAVVEKYNKFPGMQFGRRIDVYGFGDLLACHRGDARTPPQIALIQCCSGTDHAKRRDKILGTTNLDEADDTERLEAAKIAQQAKMWKQCGGIILLISWAKKGPRGQRKLWAAREERL